MISAQPNITLLKMTVAKDVTTEAVTDTYGTGKRINSVTLIKRTAKPGYTPYTKLLSQELKDRYTYADSDDFTKTVYTVTARVDGAPLIVIDASETGDIIVPAGADYTVGREKTTEVIAEDGTLPEYEEHGSQATVYVNCITGVNAGSPINEDYLKTQWADFDTYYNTQASSYFGFGAHTWKRIWTYRRIYCEGNTSTYAANVNDVSMQNWYPGNDYPYGSIYLDKTDATAQYQSADGWYGGLDMNYLAQAEEHAVAWYFYMKANKPSDITWQTRMPNGFADTKNMMATASGLAKFPYIRCCRRILGLDNYRLMNRYFVDTQAPGYNGATTSSFRFYDSVGIGNYAVDIHPIKNTAGLSPTMEKVAPFYVPYRSLASNNIRNLLVGGKQIAGTFLTNAAYRLHPIEWVIGSASGSAAALMLRDTEDNRALLNLTKLRELQTKVNENSPISWAAYDATAIPPQNGDLIINDCQNVTASTSFMAEAYYNGGARAEFYADNLLLASTTTKANGRFVATGLTTRLATGTYKFKAVIYDASDTVLDTLTVDVPVTNDIDPTYEDPIIIDDIDSDFSTTGMWTTGSAQSNKWGSTYHYSWSTSGPSTATWNFSDIPNGIYKVQTFYPNAYNRSTAAPFVITHAGGEMTTVYINQVAYGGEWVDLGEYSFSADTGAVVMLSNNVPPAEDLLVCADAVRIMRKVGSPVTLSAFELE